MIALRRQIANAKTAHWLSIAILLVFSGVVAYSETPHHTAQAVALVGLIAVIGALAHALHGIEDRIRLEHLDRRIAYLGTASDDETVNETEYRLASLAQCRTKRNALRYANLRHV